MAKTNKVAAVGVAHTVTVTHWRLVVDGGKRRWMVPDATMVGGALEV